VAQDHVFAIYFDRIFFVLENLTEEKPRVVYEIIETMLPAAAYSERNPNAHKLLEL